MEAVQFTQIKVSLPLRWRDNSTKICSRFVQDCTHELYNSALFGVTWVIIKHLKPGINLPLDYTACFSILSGSSYISNSLTAL